MTNPKKVTSLSISEELLIELDEWVQICHDENLMITRSDLIVLLLRRGLHILQEDMGEVSCLNTLVQELYQEQIQYYDDYNLTLRRPDGS